jgi:murein DD-endopeptidase MepM/ murein hydrolase activator NlpD
MARIRYHYNPRTCNYEAVRRSAWDVILDIVGYVTLSFIFGLLLTVFYHNYFDSPKEAALRAANEQLQQHYQRLAIEIKKGNEQLATLRDRDNTLYRSLLDAEPIPAPVYKVGVGGIDRRKNLPKDKLIAQVTQKIEKLSHRLRLQAKSYDELGRLARHKEKFLGAIPAIQPISNRQLKRLASGFGMRVHPIFKVRRMHEGLDYAAPQGTPIYATGGGVVKYVNKSNTGYGNQVVIDHGYGFLTRYAHMKSFKTRAGMRVTRGQCIGYLGNTGCSSAPHLHYEVIRNGKKVNPTAYVLSGLTAHEYDTLIRLAASPNKSLD